MQLKRQPVEARQNEKHLFKREQYKREPNPKTRNFRTSRACEVRRSGQITPFVVCAVFSLSFQALVLLTKTAINHRFISTYSRFHVTWTAFKFNRNQLGMVSAYVM